MAPHFLNLDTRWSFDVSRTTEHRLSSGKFNTNVFFVCYCGLHVIMYKKVTLEEWGVFALICLLIFMKFDV